LFARAADAGGFIVEASTLAGNMVGKALVEKSTTLASLRKSLEIDGQLVSNGIVLDGSLDNLPLEKTVLLNGIEPRSRVHDFLRNGQDLSKLNVKELEEHLMSAGVNIAGVVEKTELVKLIQQKQALDSHAAANNAAEQGTANSASNVEGREEARTEENNGTDQNAREGANVETLLEWDVIDTVFAQKEVLEAQDVSQLNQVLTEEAVQNTSIFVNFKLGDIAKGNGRIGKVEWRPGYDGPDEDGTVILACGSGNEEYVSYEELAIPSGQECQEWKDSVIAEQPPAVEAADTKAAAAADTQVSPDSGKLKKTRSSSSCVAC